MGFSLSVIHMATGSGIKKKVQVWIFRKDSASAPPYFLILQTTAVRGGFWQPVTGSVEGRESLQAAALREAQEETGLDFGARKPVAVSGAQGKFTYSKHETKFEEHGFWLEYPSNPDYFPKVKLDPMEHSDFAWVPFREAMNRVRYPSNLQMLQAIHESLTKHSSLHGSKS